MENDYDFQLDSSFLEDINIDGMLLDELLIEPFEIENAESPVIEPSRFRPAVSAEQVRDMQNSSVPVNTKRKRKWAFNLYAQWCQVRGEMTVLEDGNVSKLDENLCRFLMEVRKEKDQSEYPGKTLHEITAGIQGFLRDQGINLSFFNKNEDNFKKLRSTLDGLMKHRAASGHIKPG